MTRAEYELAEGRSRGHTVPEMRKLGYWSAMDGQGGWQTFGIPTDSTRREHERVLAQYTQPADLHPQRYGEANSG